MHKIRFKCYSVHPLENVTAVFPGLRTNRSGLLLWFQVVSFQLWKFYISFGHQCHCATVATVMSPGRAGKGKNHKENKEGSKHGRSCGGSSISCCVANMPVDATYKRKRCLEEVERAPNSAEETSSPTQEYFPGWSNLSTLEQRLG